MNNETFLRDWAKIRVGVLIMSILAAEYVVYHIGFKRGQEDMMKQVMEYLSQQGTSTPVAPSVVPDDESHRGSTM